MDEPAMLNAARWMAKTSGVTPAFGPVPEGVDVYPREGNGKKVFILVNFAHAPRTVSLPSTMHSILDGKTVSTVTLDHYGVAVLEAK
jgi:beta-galactosidase